jgi:hypothetical protein
MPLHDFFCAPCRVVIVDHFVPVHLRASEAPPSCPKCGAAASWYPAVGAIDAKEPFQQFHVQVLQRDGTHKDVTVGSLTQMRKLERESEQAHRNGEGQPMRFRMWSQDRSNGDVNTFGPDPGQRPDPTWLKTRGRGSRVTDGDRAYGPGVNDSNTSPIPE